MARESLHFARCRVGDGAVRSIVLARDFV
uniref:Uncharacterized protein n=1 Tax=Anguilla anguilla TaxID=7936 RepID=A0A0E9PVH5_ANGAN